MQIINTRLHSNSQYTIYKLADYLVFIPSVGNLVFRVFVHNKYVIGWARMVNTYNFKGIPLKPGTTYADSFKQKTNRYPYNN